MKTLYVNWYGPYTSEDIEGGNQCSDDKPNLSGEGLYWIIGKPPRARRLHYYIGKTTNTYTIRFYNHQKLKYLERDRKIYLGKVVHPMQYQYQNIDIAESMYIYFSQGGCIASENERKTQKAIETDCVIVSQFFKEDGTTYERLPKWLRIVPQFMLWDAEQKTLYYATKLDIYKDE